MFSPLSLAWHDTTTTEQTKAQLVSVKRSTAIEEDEELSFGNRGEEAGERVESHTHKWCIIMTIINCTCGYRCSSAASDAVPYSSYFCFFAVGARSVKFNARRLMLMALLCSTRLTGSGMEGCDGLSVGAVTEDG